MRGIDCMPSSATSTAKREGLAKAEASATEERFRKLGETFEVSRRIGMLLGEATMQHKLKREQQQQHSEKEEGKKSDNDEAYGDNDGCADVEKARLDNRKSDPVYLSAAREILTCLTRAQETSSSTNDLVELERRLKNSFAVEAPRMPQ